MEVAELVDARVGHVSVGVVHHRGALEVPDGQDLFLEVEGAPGEVALGVVEVAVDRTRVDDGDVAHDVLLVDGLRLVEEVDVQADLDVLVVGHALDPAGVPVGRQTLVGVREVAVVVRVAHGQARDDARRQVLGVRLPLLGRVLTDERLVERTTDEGDALLVEVLGRLAAELGSLLVEQVAGGLRAERRAEELVHRAEVDRHRVHLALVRGVHPVHVVREGREPVDVLPHTLVRGVEQVRAVAVHLDPGLRLVLRVGVAAHVVAAVDDEDLAAVLLGDPLGDGETEESRTDDDKVRVQRTLPQ